MARPGRQFLNAEHLRPSVAPTAVRRLSTAATARRAPGRTSSQVGEVVIYRSRQLRGRSHRPRLSHSESLMPIVASDLAAVGLRARERSCAVADGVADGATDATDSGGVHRTSRRPSRRGWPVLTCSRPRHCRALSRQDRQCLVGQSAGTARTVSDPISQPLATPPLRARSLSVGSDASYPIRSMIWVTAAGVACRRR